MIFPFDAYIKYAHDLDGFCLFSFSKRASPKRDQAFDKVSISSLSSNKFLGQSALQTMKKFLWNFHFFIVLKYPIYNVILVTFSCFTQAQKYLVVIKIFE